jgi:hypothetical protein
MLHGAGVGEEDVGGAHVAVDEVLRLPGDLQAMRVVEALGNLLGDVGGEARLERPARGQAPLEERGEVCTLDQLHAEVELALLLAEIIDVDDVAVLEERRDLALFEEERLEHGALRQVRADDLEGDIALEAARAGGLGAVELAHAAYGEAFDDAVSGDVLGQEGAGLLPPLHRGRQET